VIKVNNSTVGNDSIDFENSFVMEHDEGYFQGSNELQLFYQRWRPIAGTPRAVIVMVHGDFAHSGWYENLPSHEVPRGYAVYAFDRRGWGRSPGQRGYINAWSEYLDDLEAILKLVRAEEPSSPVFLMGHTGSGIIVMEYALHHPEDIKGVFCVTPVLDISVFPAAVLSVAKVLSRIAPHLTVDMSRRVDAGLDFVSHDPDFIKFIRQDPLRNGKLTPRWIAEVAAAVGRVDNQAADFPVPLLFLIAGADRAAPPEASKQFFQRVAMKDKEMHEYTGAYANLLSETIHEEVLGDIDRWLDRHL
jgi:alpha-beta hydrolase superfamily lysophospholipase